MSVAETPMNPSMIPRGALAMAGALVLFSLGVTGLVRITGTPPAASPERLREATRVEPIASRELLFLDQADGGVVIRDAKTDRVVQVIAPGTETGFIRGVMRGLARERRMHGTGNAAPFTLTSWRDGQLSLTDTATGRDIELSAFGTTNRQSFAALLEEPK